MFDHQQLANRFSRGRAERALGIVEKLAHEHRRQAFCFIAQVRPAEADVEHLARGLHGLEKEVAIGIALIGIGRADIVRHEIEAASTSGRG